jgi:hypothetical protein
LLNDQSGSVLGDSTVFSWAGCHNDDDDDDDDDEPVGVDEEGNYFDTESLVALSDSSYDNDLAASSDSDPEYDPDDEIFDEDDEDDISVFSYDADDPCVDIGVVFPDVMCKSALTQHAILNDYAFRTMKRDETLSGQVFESRQRLQVDMFLHLTA